MALWSDISNLISGNTQQKLGGAVGVLGTVIGAPELTLSERIAGTNINNTGTGATGSWGEPTPAVPTPQSPSNVTTQTPTAPAAPSSGNFMDYYPGWNPTAAAADFQATYGGDIGRLQAAKGGGSGGSSINDQLQQLINQSASEQLGILSQAEANLGGSRDVALGNVGSTVAEQMAGGQSALEQAMAAITGQRTSAEKSTQQAKSENTRNYSNIAQQILSRYGAGSSVGGALTEVAAQSFFRTSGTIFDKYQSAVDTINQAENQANNTFALYKQKVSDWEVNQKAAIEQDYKDKYLQIEMQKTNVSGWKAQAQYDLLQQAKQQLDSYRNFASQLLAQVDVARAQFAAEKTGSLQYFDNLVNNIVNNISTYNQDVSNVPSMSLIAPTQRSGNTAQYSPFFPQQNTKDTYEKLVNPFA